MMGMLKGREISNAQSSRLLFFRVCYKLHIIRLPINNDLSLVLKYLFIKAEGMGYPFEFL